MHLWRRRNLEVCGSHDVAGIQGTTRVEAPSADVCVAITVKNIKSRNVNSLPY